MIHNGLAALDESLSAHPNDPRHGKTRGFTVRIRAVTSLRDFLPSRRCGRSPPWKIP